MKSRISLISAVLCFSTIMLVGARPGRSQGGGTSKPDPAWLTQMYAEGWQKVEEGVLQRTTEGAGAVETFTYGEAGRLWRVEKLQEHIKFLENRFNDQPSNELAKVIEHLKGDLALAEGSSNPAEPDTLYEQTINCDFSYGAHAVAAPLSGSQAPGVMAQGDSYFHNNCGYLGDTYAYAYVDGWSGTVHTTKTQEDPKYGGAWLDSLAQLSLNVSSSCYSRAYASVTSSALNIFYDIQAENYACPYPPALSISGPSDVFTDDYTPCTTVTWTASVSGGTPGYSAVNWYIGTTYQTSGSTFSQTYCYTNQTVTVRATVSDSLGMTAENSFSTNVHYFANDPCAGDPCCGDPCCFQQIKSSEDSIQRPICYYQ